MSTVSLTGVGAIITILNTILPLVGIDLPDGALEGVVDAVVTLVGFGLLIYGQLRRKDLEYGIFRK